MLAILPTTSARNPSKDKSASVRLSRRRRPAFQEMIKDSDKHLFDMVIVWKLDRFSRDRYDSARYKVLLKKNNVRVVSATEVISSGADGILLESVLEGFAEYYSADLAEKVTPRHNRERFEMQIQRRFHAHRLCD